VRFVRILLPLLAALVAHQASGQSVTIPATTPAVVLAHLKGRLLSQGYKVEKGNDKQAVFTFDKGLVAQQAGAQVPFVQITIELQIRFKQKGDSVSVTAREEAVGERGRPLEFRNPMDSQHDSLQRFLDTIREEVQSGAPPHDTTRVNTDSSRSF
jgi:hypothetical protein